MKKQNIYKKLVVRTKGLIKSARIPRTFSKKNNNVFSNEKHIIMQVLMQKEKKHYRASICESRFSALKRKYSDMIYAKKFVSQKNELLCRVLAYNLGIIVNLSVVEIYFLQSLLEFKNGLVKSFLIDIKFIIEVLLIGINYRSLIDFAEHHYEIDI